MGVFFLFLLATSAGTVSTLFSIPEDDLGRGYFQMNALVILGLLGLAGAVLLFSPLEPFADRAALGNAGVAAAFATALLYWGAVWRERWRGARLAALGALTACGVALWLAGVALIPAPTTLPYRSALLGATLAISALLLGWSLVTMLLGHWYLVAPRLAFDHLILFCRILLAVVILRCAIVATALWAATTFDPAAGTAPIALVTGFAGQGMFFWFRLLWGLVIPLLLAAMSLHCARQRSNQSATGILYVLVVGTLIGEITSYYLTLTTGVPV